jgi:hypothetical protein
MRLLILSLIVFLISPLASAKGLTVTCGESTGYAYYFEGGAVNKKIRVLQPTGLQEDFLLLP